MFPIWTRKASMERLLRRLRVTGGYSVSRSSCLALRESSGWDRAQRVLSLFAEFAHAKTYRVASFSDGFGPITAVINISGNSSPRRKASLPAAFLERRLPGCGYAFFICSGLREG